MVEWDEVQVPWIRLIVIFWSDCLVAERLLIGEQEAERGLFGFVLRSRDPAAGRLSQAMLFAAALVLDCSLPRGVVAVMLSTWHRYRQPRLGARSVLV